MTKKRINEVLVERCINLQAFWRHVASGSNEGVGHRIDQLTGNAEITNLYFTLTVHLKLKND
jgi:hypothetical protein